MHNAPQGSSTVSQPDSESQGISETVIDEELGAGDNMSKAILSSLIC